MQATASELFIDSNNISWEATGPGVQRKILAWDESLMLVKVDFEKDAIGPLHQHPHVQITHIESGTFEVEIDGKKKVLKAGDAFYIPSNIWHGVVCLEAGALLDAFSPMRKEFLP